MKNWKDVEEVKRAPGKATADGKVVCPCALWSRIYDANSLAFSRGECELDHAEGCNGKGERE